METFPEKLKGRKYYQPGDMGLEKEIKKRLEWWQRVKEKIPPEKKP
jgi:putative ATPase